MIIATRLIMRVQNGISFKCYTLDCSIIVNFLTKQVAIFGTKMAIIIANRWIVVYIFCDLGHCPLLVPRAHASPFSAGAHGNSIYRRPIMWNSGDVYQFARDVGHGWIRCAIYQFGVRPF